MDEVSLGKVLQEARKRAGLTQQQLCQQADLSYSTLAKIERGAIKAPSVFTIQSIATTLGLSLDQLIGNSVESPSLSQASQKKQSKSGVRFVYFDINGCLVRFYHRAFTAIAEASGQQADMVESTFWHYNDVACRGEMPMDEFNSILGQKFLLPDFDWRTYYLEAVEPIEEMTSVLNWAKEHYHVGLLSNIMPGLITQLMNRDMLPNIRYDVIIDSSQENSIKPEQRIFDIAQQKAGMHPDEILFVDDSRTNIMAAEKCGWKVMWFDDYRPDESAARVRTALEF